MQVERARGEMCVVFFHLRRNERYIFLKRKVGNVLQFSAFCISYKALEKKMYVGHRISSV